MTKPARSQRSSVALAFATFGRTFRHSYDNLLSMGLMGIIWLVAALLFVPIGPLTAGLHRVTQRWSEERVASWREMYASWRGDALWSWWLTLALWGGELLLLINVNTYGSSQFLLLNYLSITFLLFAFIWLAVGMVAFPLALRQEEPSARRTIRNAVVMVFANLPGALVALVLLIVSTVVLILLPPLFVFVPGWIALWGQEFSRLLLVRSGYLAPDEIADRHE